MFIYYLKYFHNNYENHFPIQHLLLIAQLFDQYIPPKINLYYNYLQN